MRITYSGAAYRMYAQENPDGCQAVEMAPAVWQIYIEDYENTECPVVSTRTRCRLLVHKPGQGWSDFGSIGLVLSTRGQLDYIETYYK